MTPEKKTSVFRKAGGSEFRRNIKIFSKYNNRNQIYHINLEFNVTS